VVTPQLDFQLLQFTNVYNFVNTQHTCLPTRSGCGQAASSSCMISLSSIMRFNSRSTVVLTKHYKELVKKLTTDNYLFSNHRIVFVVGIVCITQLSCKQCEFEWIRHKHDTPFGWNSNSRNSWPNLPLWPT
jgi:hypothetical protein